MTDDTFQDFDDDAQAPAHLKGMITAEIDIVRDIMQVVQMFLGETMVTGVVLLQELEKNKKDEDK
ncbi:hypothetical protein [Emticicia agri]|uniref:Uncharacterized protein n=1 Tax=Emticicia agri TaxID=2492393 RepID=A0A4Q5LZH9_9BACT|nr:hypothetical protein [Emticicia agri]RYU95321.1 hypothetical protein EWM59_12790 [Emticicia agri]